MNELVNGEPPAEEQSFAEAEKLLQEGTVFEKASEAENEDMRIEDVQIETEVVKTETEHVKAEDAQTSKEPGPESVITEDMVIEGNVTTRSGLKLFGTVNGNVSCEGNIYMTGRIEGEVTADSLTMQSGSICGNVHSKKDIIIEHQAGIKGDIGCQRLVMNGQVEGSILTTESIELKEAAVLIGNAASGNISVHTGAKVKGLIEIGEV